MKLIIKSFSYIFHPLFMSLAGVGLYFYLTPRYFLEEFIYSKLFATTIMTVIIPILSFFMLKNLQVVETIHLKSVKERRYPLLMQMVFTFLLLQLIFVGYEIPELYFFFVGILGASIAAYILALLKFKVSLHMIGISGLIVFVIGLSLHFGSNYLALICFLVLCAGFTATSRLDAKAHTSVELIFGFVVGTVTQFLTFPYWL